MPYSSIKAIHKQLPSVTSYCVIRVFINHINAIKCKNDDTDITQLQLDTVTDVRLCAYILQLASYTQKHAHAYIYTKTLASTIAINTQNPYIVYSKHYTQLTTVRTIMHMQQCTNVLHTSACMHHQLHALTKILSSYIEQLYLVIASQQYRESLK